jgi:CheY-like chemotaxis protein/DNA-binding XRE family transcriptional regulator
LNSQASLILPGKFMAATQITSRFGASVRAIRQRLGISQEALAERADLHRTYITGIEAGVRNVTLNSIDKLARALEVSAASLLQLGHRPPSPPTHSSGESSLSQFVDILMVEDDPQDVEMTLLAFKRARITNSLQVVCDGQQALDFLFCTGTFAHRQMENRPNLVLLDLKLPKVDGLDVLRKIKADERLRSIPVVVLTGSRDARTFSECQRLGAATFIVKPVDFQKLGRVTPQLNLDWALLQQPPAESRVTSGVSLAP